MNKFKFLILNVVIYTVFVFLMCQFFIYGVNTNNFFQIVSPTILLVAGIGISLYNIKSKGLLNTAAELAVCSFMYLCYIQVTKTEYDILSSNYSFIVAIRGLITLVGAILIIKVCQVIILPLIKYAEIYSIVNDTGVLRSFIGCIKDLDSTLMIPFLDYILRKSFTQLFNTVKSVNESVNEENKDKERSVTQQKIDGIFESLKDTKIAKASTRLLKMYAEWPDECVLAYCYLYPDMPLYKAILQGIGIFVKHSPIIIGQIAAIVVLSYIVRGFTVMASLVYIWNHGNLTIINLFFFILLIYGIQFILVNTISNYIMMSTVVSTYLKKAKDDDDDYVNEVAASMPGLGLLKKLFGIGPDTQNTENNQNNAENSENTEDNNSNTQESTRNSENSVDNLQKPSEASVEEPKI